MTLKSECDAVTISAGWIPNTDGIGVSSAGVEINDRGYIWVDDCLQTSQPHIFAAGDVTGRMMLVTAAMQEGYVAAGNALEWIKANPCVTRLFRPVVFLDRNTDPLG